MSNVVQSAPSADRAASQEPRSAPPSPSPEPSPDPSPAPSPLPSPVPSSSSRKRGRLYVLDGLRLGAALMVVAYHYTALGAAAWDRPAQEVFPGVSRFSSYGYLGVQLFFVISGFVICMSAWDRPLKAFFVSRVVRLYPAYWFAVLATTVTLALIPGERQRLPGYDVLTNLTMLQEPLGVRPVDAVYWTLFAEIRFYLLFAVLVGIGLTYRRVVLFCCVWGAVSLLVTEAGPGPLRTLVMPEHSWFFIAGTAFYLMYRFRPNLLLFGIVGFSFCVSLAPAVEQFEHVSRVGGQARWPVIAVLAVIFGLMALIATGKLSGVQWRWLPVAGALTYPLYLLHEFIGWEVFGHFSARGVHPWVLVGATTAGMLVLSYLVYRLVEAPLSGCLKRRLS
ncbi:MULTISPECIES: acyltransferase family protein [unclassified Streptomyces]|uniref:acyltransferase family protein n=1 Tax=unclassified Streptomyces TaxID=2593676 RepID=UPI0036FB6A97